MSRFSDPEENMGCKAFFLVLLLSILGESIVHALGNLNDWAPEGPFCSYRRHRITHHALRRKIAFPRTACPPSAVPRTAADCSAKLRYTVLECCGGATQIAMTQLLQYRRHSEGGSSFVSSCCVIAKVTAAAANDLWSASINVT